MKIRLYSKIKCEWITIGRILKKLEIDRRMNRMRNVKLEQISIDRTQTRHSEKQWKAREVFAIEIKCT